MVDEAFDLGDKFFAAAERTPTDSVLGIDVELKPPRVVRVCVSLAAIRKLRVLPAPSSRCLAFRNTPFRWQWWAR